MGIELSLSDAKGSLQKKITTFFCDKCHKPGGGVWRPSCHKKITTSQNPFLAIWSTFRDFLFSRGGGSEAGPLASDPLVHLFSLSEYIFG